MRIRFRRRKNASPSISPPKRRLPREYRSRGGSDAIAALQRDVAAEAHDWIPSNPKDAPFIDRLKPTLTLHRNCQIWGDLSAIELTAAQLSHPYVRAHGHGAENAGVTKR
jgi:hypothetical protein